MSTKHVLLALLEIKPSTGYDLAFRSLLSLSPLWSATHSQVYTALHKLRDEGLVEVADETPTGRRPRTVYVITEAGRAELDLWRRQPVQYLPARDPFRLWTMYMDTADPKVALANIDEHIDRHRTAAQELRQHAEVIRAGRGPVLELRRDWMSPREMERARVARTAVYEELARQAEFEVESAARLRETLLELHPKLDQAPASPKKRRRA